MGVVVFTYAAVFWLERSIHTKGKSMIRAPMLSAVEIRTFLGLLISVILPFPLDKQLYHGQDQNDGKQDHRTGGGPAQLPLDIELVIQVIHYRVQGIGRTRLPVEQREQLGKDLGSGDHVHDQGQTNGGGDQRQGNAPEDQPFLGSVYPGGSAVLGPANYKQGCSAS